MPQPHVIRLRGPWLCWPESRDGTTEESAITIDCRDEDGLSQLREPSPKTRVVFGRRFHRPTGLSATTSVQLVVQNSTPEMTLSLNSQQLGSVDSGRHEFDVSHALQPANQLRIDMPAESVRAGRALTDLFCCQLEIV